MNPEIIGYSPKGFIYINNKGFLMSLQVTASPDALGNSFSRLPEYENMDEALAANPQLNPS